MIYKIVAAIVKFGTGILCRIDTPDIHKVEEQGPLIVISNHKRTDFHIRVGESFRLKLEGVKVIREIRQQIADEIMIWLAELLPPAYHGAYEKVTKNEIILTESVK